MHIHSTVAKLSTHDCSKRKHLQLSKPRFPLNFLVIHVIIHRLSGLHATRAPHPFPVRRECRTVTDDSQPHPANTPPQLRDLHPACGEDCAEPPGVHSPSASTSLIMSWSSASVGFCPRERITVPSSLVVMVPSPSLSNRENASLNSAICSSVSWSACGSVVCGQTEVRTYSRCS